MNLFFSLLPLYLIGNLHCAAMCGPLVMWIGKHRYKNYYFIGRLFSFTLAGIFSAEVGMIFHASSIPYSLSAFFALFIGIVIMSNGFLTLFNWSFPGKKWIAKNTAGLSMQLASLMAKDKILPTFLFGFFTLALPCGQTLVVFSACALNGDPLTGLANGFLFALLTSPSLIAVLHAQNLFKRFKNSYTFAWGATAICIGLLACLRGLADFGFFPHSSISFNNSWGTHIVFF